ncbi:MAG: hypothetical protein WC421_04735 [Elusimicrobiales bacterium]
MAGERMPQIVKTEAAYFSLLQGLVKTATQRDYRKVKDTLAGMRHFRQQGI